MESIEWVADLQIEAPVAPVAHHCFAAQHLAEMERIVREIQENSLNQANQMARFRQGMVQCLYRHHHMSYRAIADLLGGISPSRVRQIEIGE